MSGRHGSRNFTQAIGAHSARVNAQPSMLEFGTIESYNPTNNTATVMRTIVQEKTSNCQIMVPWMGNQYGAQGGPPIGVLCILARIDQRANQFVILGFIANNVDQAFNVPSDDYEVLDKRGSFVWLTSVRDGALRLFGATIATLFAGTRIELGGEGLDTTNQAVIRKEDLDAYGATLTANTQAAIDALAAITHGGTGVAPPTVASATSTGSTKVTAA